MDYFYQGQIRRYILQTVRFFSNFNVKQSDGTLIRIPVTYGDMDRQVANILNQNSESGSITAPKISIYITDLLLDRDRLSDSTFISKVHIRERAIEDGVYTGEQGTNYTVERLMPTPFMLKMKVDILSSNNDQKLQMVEQILMFFNPSLEIQTSDNYLDWTSLSVLDLLDVIYTSKQVPVGTNTMVFDTTTLVLQTPIWLSPPAKVKKMGIITKVLTSLYDDIDTGEGNYLEGLGMSLGLSEPTPVSKIATLAETIGNYDIVVTGKSVLILDRKQPEQNYLSWYNLIEQLPGDYQAGLAKIYLRQPDDTEVTGFGSINVLDEKVMTISDWDIDTYPTNTLLPGPSRANSSWGSFDLIIDPLTTAPKNPIIGTRYLIINSVGGGNRDYFVTRGPVNTFKTNTLASKVNSYKVYVDKVEVSSTVPPLDVYTDMSANNISGVGNDATFDITSDIYNEMYSGNVSSLGSGYMVGDRLRIKGTSLGGTIVENDCIVYVRRVDAAGGIMEAKYVGIPKPVNFTIALDVEVAKGKEISYELFMNEDGPDAWKNVDGSDFFADANDIIEWDGSKWNLVFDASIDFKITYQTNLNTLTQYKWFDGAWVKSFEGRYNSGYWRITL